MFKTLLKLKLISFKNVVKRVCNNKNQKEKKKIDFIPQNLQCTQKAIEIWIKAIFILRDIQDSDIKDGFFFTKETTISIIFFYK